MGASPLVPPRLPELDLKQPSAGSFTTGFTALAA